MTTTKRLLASSPHLKYVQGCCGEVGVDLEGYLIVEIGTMLSQL